MPAKRYRIRPDKELTSSERMDQDRRRSFGTRLRRARVGRGLTQEELSELTSIMARDLSDMENARRWPRPGTRQVLAEHLDVPVEYLWPWPIPADDLR